MGWTDDLESYGVREPPSQVPYLGIPSDARHSRSRSRSRTRQSTSSRPNHSRSRAERLRPTPSLVLGETSRAGGEERRGRNARQHLRHVPSAPMITLTDTGNTMTSHGTYQDDPEDDAVCETGPTYGNSQPAEATHVIHLVAPPTSQSNAPPSIHRSHRRHHDEGSTEHHSRKKHSSHSGSLRQREHSTMMDVPSHSTHSRRNHPPIQREVLRTRQETSVEYDGWAGGFSYQIQVREGFTQETGEMQCIRSAPYGHPQMHACPARSSSFVGGFVLDSAW